ncbi:MAG: hypothetical protein EZS28_038010, partial [Streblomastix strix]
EIEAREDVIAKRKQEYERAGFEEQSIGQRFFPPIISFLGLVLVALFIVSAVYAFNNAKRYNLDYDQNRLVDDILNKCKFGLEEITGGSTDRRIGMKKNDESDKLYQQGEGLCQKELSNAVNFLCDDDLIDRNAEPIDGEPVLKDTDNMIIGCNDNTTDLPLPNTTTTHTGPDACSCMTLVQMISEPVRSSEHRVRPFVVAVVRNYVRPAIQGIDLIVGIGSLVLGGLFLLYVLTVFMAWLYSIVRAYYREIEAREDVIAKRKQELDKREKQVLSKHHPETESHEPTKKQRGPRGDRELEQVQTDSEGSRGVEERNFEPPQETANIPSDATDTTSAQITTQNVEKQHCIKWESWMEKKKNKKWN